MNDGNWRAIREDHKVVYYSQKKPEGIVGLFNVISEVYEDTFAGVTELCYKIEPLYVMSGNECPKKIRLMKDLGFKSTMQGTINRLKPDEYRRIKFVILGMKEPENHEGVVSLFSKIHNYIGFPLVTTIRQSYPDITVEGTDKKEIKIEIEFDSDDFRKDMDRGVHDPKKCDVIVCWKDG